MATISENLTQLVQCKADMKSALIYKVSEPSGGLETYADAIMNIHPVDSQIRLLDYECINELGVGESSDCTICNSNVDTGYLLGHDGNNILQYLNGFKTRASLIMCANEFAKEDNYVFTITKEADATAETIQQTFNITGDAIKQATGAPTGYNLYRAYIAMNGTRSATVEYNGHYPVDIYIACGREKTKGDLSIKNSDGYIIAQTKQSLSSNNIAQYTKYTLRGPEKFTFELINATSGQGGYFYIAVPPYIEESKSISGQFSIKHKKCGKYLSFTSDNSIEFLDNKFLLTVIDAQGSIQGRAPFIQPEDTELTDLLLIQDINSQKYLGTTSKDNFYLNEEANDTCLWTLYSL